MIRSEFDYIIFLDFDGVLCTERQAIALDERGVIAGLDPVALGFLNRLCRETPKPAIVISSTWRMGGNSREFYQLFMAGGFVDLAKSVHEKWATPVCADGSRGDEIAKWMDNYGKCQYLILDDDDDMQPCQLPYFVCTNSEDGMLMKHYIAAENIIKGFAND